ncbi:MAG: hypothetical protein WAO46_01610, partial [Tepidanaerobacteraceae bacterium]
CILMVLYITKKALTNKIQPFKRESNENEKLVMKDCNKWNKNKKRQNNYESPCISTAFKLALFILMMY